MSHLGELKAYSKQRVSEDDGMCVMMNKCEYETGVSSIVRWRGTVGGKGCADPRKRQQIGVGGA